MTAGSLIFFPFYKRGNLTSADGGRTSIGYSNSNAGECVRDTCVTESNTVVASSDGIEGSEKFRWLYKRSIPIIVRI